MSMLGDGAVAIWHDIAPEGRDAFYAWHGQEHMPERVAIPGFLRGRRFIAIEADREFFNLYETRDADVVGSAAYKERLENPTPWTLATVRHFRAVARSLCRVAATQGQADGGVIATLRWSPEAEGAHGAEDEARALLPSLLAIPGVAAGHLLVADMEASGFVNAEQRARGAANEVPSPIVVLEGWADEAPFIASVTAMVARATAAERLAEARLRLGFYRHQITTWPR